MTIPGINSIQNQNTRPLFENCILYNPNQEKCFDGQSGMFLDGESTITFSMFIVILL